MVFEVREGGLFSAKEVRDDCKLSFFTVLIPNMVSYNLYLLPSFPYIAATYENKRLKFEWLPPCTMIPRSDKFA